MPNTRHRVQFQMYFLYLACMKCCRSYHFIIGLLLAFSVTDRCAYAQEQEPSALYFPHPLEAGRWEKSVGVTLLTIPRDIAEEEINIAPTIDFQTAVGLPWQFSITGRLTLQYVTNHVQLGWKMDAGAGSMWNRTGTRCRLLVWLYEYRGFRQHHDGMGVLSQCFPRLED